MRRPPLLMLGLLAASAVGCEGGTVVLLPPPPPPSGRVAYLQVRDALGKDTVNILPDRTVQLTDSALDGSLNGVARTWVAHWSSSNPAAATVDASGLVSSIAPGDAWIVAWIKPDSSQIFRDSALVRVITPN